MLSNLIRKTECSENSGFYKQYSARKPIRYSAGLFSGGCITDPFYVSLTEIPYSSTLITAMLP